jgi:uncharacterized protein YggT (Ycf19 family)
MADRFVRVTKVTRSSDGTTPVNAADADTEVVNGFTSVAARAIWLIAGLLLLLLAFRFVLALLGANPANTFADFIYTTSHPFVSPFFTLFGYNLQYGVSRFELFTLIAMAVYAAVAWVLTSVIMLAHRPRVMA